MISAPGVVSQRAHVELAVVGAENNTDYTTRFGGLFTVKYPQSVETISVERSGRTPY